MIKLPKPDVYAYELATHSNTLQAFSAETMLAYSAAVSDALRAEVERLEGKNALLTQSATFVTDELRAEVERLKQDVPEVGFGNTEQAEPVGEAYLCDECSTPFDGGYECPKCGHNTATKEPVYTAPQGQTELLRQALEALETRDVRLHEAAIVAIKQHLEGTNGRYY